MDSDHDLEGEEALQELEQGSGGVANPIPNVQPHAADLPAGADSEQQHPSADSITASTLKAALTSALEGKDLDTISVQEIRHSMARQFGLPGDGLDSRKKEL